jgi:hypothetical protein
LRQSSIFLFPGASPVLPAGSTTKHQSQLDVPRQSLIPFQNATFVDNVHAIFTAQFAWLSNLANL